MSLDLLRRSYSPQGRRPVARTAPCATVAPTYPVLRKDVEYKGRAEKRPTQDPHARTAFGAPDRTRRVFMSDLKVRPRAGEWAKGRRFGRMKFREKDSWRMR